MESASQRPSRGHRKYSDLAIVTTLTLRTVFRLPLRQTEGFVSSLIALMGLEILGDGEWQAHKPKISDQRRSWRDGERYIGKMRLC